MSIKIIPTVPFDDVPGSLPKGSIPENADHANIAQTAIELLNSLQTGYLADNIIWRDLLSFTDSIRTFYSIDTVFNTFQELRLLKKCSAFSLSGTAPRLIPCGESSWLDVDVRFKTIDGPLTGICAGVVSVSPDIDGNMKIWMLRTWLEGFQGEPNPDHLEPTNSKRGKGEVEDVPNTEHRHIYDAIIAGGGQGGLGLAGRLQAVGLDYILFDNRPDIGDSWGHRYDSLKWHTVREYGNLPFGRTFAADEENLLPAKRIGAGYKAWADKYGINVRSATNVDTATWDPPTQTWTIHTSGTTGTQEWTSKNLILCIGPGAKSPISPDWATPEKIKASRFKGTIMHSATYRNPDDFAGKRGVVIGTANTAHDVAESMANVGMDTTMVQRNPTFIFPGAWLTAFHGRDYNLDKPTDEADREQVTQPYKIQREMANRIIRHLIEAHPEQFDALENAGFRVDRYGDLYNNLYVRFGGHYIDIGSCARIVKGEIKMKQGAIDALTEDGLRFADGSQLKADLIVLCTGFDHDFPKEASKIVGEQTAKQMGNFWGMDTEGELQGFAKVAGHPHLYYHGTEARLARFFSRFLALQLQKEKLGQPLRPYSK